MSRPPFTAWDYQPRYLSELLAIQVGSAPLHEPMWFYVNFGVRPDSPQSATQQPLTHSRGFDAITNLTITVPGTHSFSNPAASAVEHGCLGIKADNGHLLAIKLDFGQSGSGHDFRPRLPLVCHW